MFRMGRLLPQRELRNNNAQVIDAVAAGETFIVTRNGERVAELRPVSLARRTFIPRDEIAALASPGRRIDRHRFRAELDGVIDQTI
jgi:prevent-host-death family protein